MAWQSFALQGDHWLATHASSAHHGWPFSFNHIMAIMVDWLGIWTPARYKLTWTDFYMVLQEVENHADIEIVAKLIKRVCEKSFVIRNTF